MPFDNTEPPTDVRNLLTLADALEREHADFQWGFSDVYYKTECGSTGCAIGMAIHIGLIPDSPGVFPNIENVLGISGAQSSDIFDNPHEYGVADYDEVTPAMVAARLREIAAEKMAARVEAV